MIQQLAHAASFLCALAAAYTGYVGCTFPRQPGKAAVSFLGAAGWLGAGALLAIA